MGLSSSQGRLLMLTSRLSDVELGEVMISQRQSELARNSEKVAKEYNDAISNYKLVVKVSDSSERLGFRKEDLNYKNASQAGYIVTDANKNVYLKKDDDGNWIIPKDMDGNNLLSINADGKAVVGTTEYEIKDGKDFLTNGETLQNAIMNGVLTLYKKDDTASGIELENLAADTNMEYVLDTSDDSAAESKYNYETARLSRQDSQLEVELKQLETQHQALMKEMESVEKVIDNNIERTFKLFSDG